MKDASIMCCHVLPPSRRWLLAHLLAQMVAGMVAVAMSPAAWATSLPASAPAAAAPQAETEVTSVAQARAALQADAQTLSTEMDGWLVVQQPAQNAQWSFAPASHAAHPAALRRVIVRGADGRRSVQTRMWCEGPAAACSALEQEFARSSDRLQQYLRSRDNAGPPAARP